MVHVYIIVKIFALDKTSAKLSFQFPTPSRSTSFIAVAADVFDITASISLST